MIEMNNKWIIKMSNDKVYFNENRYILMSNSNFPSSEDYKFKSHFEIYWEVTIDVNTEKSLFILTVLNYNHNDVSSFNAQQLNDNITRIEFVDLDWTRLEPLFTSYRTKSFKDIVTNFPNYDELPTTDHEEYEESNNTEEPYKKTEETISRYEKEQEKIEKKEILIPFKYKIKFIDAIFREGGITVKKFKTGYKLKPNVTLNIENANILPEFDNIKYYFHKVFGTRFFNASGTIVINNGWVERIEKVGSIEIESIDSSIIDKVRNLQIEGITNYKTEDSNKKKLLTSKEIHDLIRKKEGDSATLITSEKEIVDTIINQERNLTNRKQLTFISGSVHNVFDKIKYTIKPKFGFLFSITGKNMTHYCWELLDSHATYIWSMPESIGRDEYSNRIEKTINFIIDNGRNKYKRTKKNGDIDSDIEFVALSHRKKGPLNGDRFVNWKNKFMSIIEKNND
jgi:hypothetical protein